MFFLYLLMLGFAVFYLDLKTTLRCFIFPSISGLVNAFRTRASFLQDTGLTLVITRLISPRHRLAFRSSDYLQARISHKAIIAITSDYKFQLRFILGASRPDVNARSSRPNPPLMQPPMLHISQKSLPQFSK